MGADQSSSSPPCLRPEGGENSHVEHLSLLAAAGGPAALTDVLARVRTADPARADAREAVIAQAWATPSDDKDTNTPPPPGGRGGLSLHEGK